MYEKPKIVIFLLEDLNFVRTSEEGFESWYDENVDFGGWT